MQVIDAKRDDDLGSLGKSTSTVRTTLEQRLWRGIVLPLGLAYLDRPASSCKD